MSGASPATQSLEALRALAVAAIDAAYDHGLSQDDPHAEHDVIAREADEAQVALLAAVERLSTPHRSATPSGDIGALVDAYGDAERDVGDRRYDTSLGDVGHASYRAERDRAKAALLDEVRALRGAVERADAERLRLREELSASREERDAAHEYLDRCPVGVPRTVEGRTDLRERIHYLAEHWGVADAQLRSSERERDKACAAAAVADMAVGVLNKRLEAVEAQLRNARAERAP